jgi:hypothetical protein
MLMLTRSSPSSVRNRGAAKLRERCRARARCRPFSRRALPSRALPPPFLGLPEQQQQAKSPDERGSVCRLNATPWRELRYSRTRPMTSCESCDSRDKRELFRRCSTVRRDRSISTMRAATDTTLNATASRSSSRARGTPCGANVAAHPLHRC